MRDTADNEQLLERPVGRLSYRQKHYFQWTPQDVADAIRDGTYLNGAPHALTPERNSDQ